MKNNIVKRVSLIVLGSIFLIFSILLSCKTTTKNRVVIYPEYYMHIAALQKENYSNCDSAIVNYNRAIDAHYLLKEEARRDSTLAKIYFEKGNCQNHLGMLDSALVSILSSKKYGYKPLDIYSELGDIYLKLEKIDSAIVYLKRAYDLNPLDPSITYGIGAAYSDLEEYQQAVYYLTKSIAIDPCGKDSWCDAYRIRAKGYFFLGEFDEAINDINKHMELVDRQKTVPGDAGLIKAKSYYMKQDYKDAAKYYEFYLSQARGENIGICKNMIGVCNEALYKKDSTEKLAQKVFYWYQEGAKEGNHESLFNLARCYFNGLGTVKDYRKAYSYMKMAAQQGETMSSYFLGRFYGSEFDSTWYDKDQIYWFKQAAFQNDYLAQYRLGILYHQRSDSQKDQDSAKYWLKRAKNSGLKDAVEFYDKTWPNE